MRTASDKLNINRNVHGSSLFYFILSNRFCFWPIERMNLTYIIAKHGDRSLLRLPLLLLCASTQRVLWNLFSGGNLLITLKTKFDEHKMTKQVSDLLPTESDRAGERSKKKRYDFEIIWRWNGRKNIYVRSKNKTPNWRVAFTEPLKSYDCFPNCAGYFRGMEIFILTHTPHTHTHS